MLLKCRGKRFRRTKEELEEGIGKAAGEETQRHS